MNKLLFVFLTALIISGCGTVSPDAGEEAVLVEQPWFFGHGGVDRDPVRTGFTWTAITTDAIIYNLKPQQYDETFDNIVTADNNPVDFHAYIELQILENKTPILHERWGMEWYKNKIQERFRFEIRNQCRHYTMFDLTTNGDVTIKIAEVTLGVMKAFIEGQDMPIQTNRVTIGKVYPPKEVIEETIKTAAQIQRIKTEYSRANAETSRKQAEINKAMADHAYAQQFGMSTTDYLHLRQLEIQKELLEVVKGKENVTTILNFGGAQPFLDVKGK